MELQGKIIAIREPKTIKEDFRTMDFVVETEEKYPQKVRLTAKNEVIEDILSHGVGFSSTFKFNIKGREYKDEIYNTLDCWSIGKASKPSATTAKPTKATEKSDDLPF